MQFCKFSGFLLICLNPMNEANSWAGQAKKRWGNSIDPMEGLWRVEVKKCCQEKMSNLYRVWKENNSKIRKNLRMIKNYMQFWKMIKIIFAKYIFHMELNWKELLMFFYILSWIYFISKHSWEFNVGEFKPNIWFKYS